MSSVPSWRRPRRRCHGRYLSAGGNDITDTDTTTDGLQFSPGVGYHTVQIKVTAEDDVTTETITLALIREAVAPLFSTTMTVGDVSSGARGYEHIPSGGSVAARSVEFVSGSTYRLKGLMARTGGVSLYFR